MEIERIKALLPEVVALVESRSPYAAAEATSRTGTSIAVDSREKQVTPDPTVEGIVVTASNGYYLEEYATATFEREALLAEVRHWLDGLRPPQLSEAPLGLAPLEPLTRDYRTEVAIDPATIPLPQKLEQLSARQAHAASLDPRIIDASVRYNESKQTMVFAAPGRLLSQQLARTRLATVITVRDDAGRISYDWQLDGGAGGYEFVEQSGTGISRPVEEILETALLLLTAERIAPGFYDCVTDPGVSGLLAHESFGHGVETDMFLKGRALAADYLGRRMAEDYVNLSDDPTVAGAYGSYFFDDEGMVARTTPIIEKGVFGGGISDLYSAARLGIARTGNGRRQSYLHKAYARMSNTFFVPGTTPVDEIIGSVDDGFYLVQGSSGMEDPKHWGIQLVLHYAKEIKNGKLTGRLFSPITVTGAVPEVLASISHVGDDFALDAGICGKGHKEYVMVSSGGPHLRLRARLS